MGKHQSARSAGNMTSKTLAKNLKMRMPHVQTVEARTHPNIRDANFSMQTFPFTYKQATTKNKMATTTTHKKTTNNQIYSRDKASETKPKTRTKTAILQLSKKQ